MNDNIKNDIDELLIELLKSTKKKKNVYLSECEISSNEITQFMKQLNEDVDEKEPITISFQITKSTEKMLMFIMKKFPQYKIEHLCKLFMIYSLGLNFDTSDKRQKYFNVMDKN